MRLKSFMQLSVFGGTCEIKKCLKMMVIGVWFGLLLNFGFVGWVKVSDRCIIRLASMLFKVRVFFRTYNVQGNGGFWGVVRGQNWLFVGGVGVGGMGEVIN